MGYLLKIDSGSYHGSKTTGGRASRHPGQIRSAREHEALRFTSNLIADGHDAREVIDQVQAQLVALLGLRAARFEQGRLIGRPPRFTNDGGLAWGDVRWNLDEHGFPNEDVELLARSGGRTRGRFLLISVPGTAPSREARQVAIRLADLVGAALAGERRPLA